MATKLSQAAQQIKDDDDRNAKIAGLYGDLSAAITGKKPKEEIQALRDDISVLENPPTEEHEDEKPMTLAPEATLSAEDVSHTLATMEEEGGVPDKTWKVPALENHFDIIRREVQIAHLYTGVQRYRLGRCLCRDQLGHDQGYG